MAWTPERGRPWNRLKERGGRKRFLSRTENDPSWRQRVYSLDHVERHADVGGGGVVVADDGGETVRAEGIEAVGGGCRWRPCEARKRWTVVSAV